MITFYRANYDLSVPEPGGCPTLRVPGRIGEILGECGAAIQVAFDTISLWETLRIAASLPRDRRIMLEAGTPLLKAVGLRNAVSVLRGVAEDVRAVIADTKTVDAGSVEARVAAESGADAVTVLSAAHDKTLEDTVAEAERNGMAVYVDLMTSRDPLGDAERAASLGAHVLLLHLGVDVQEALGKTAAELVDIVKGLSRKDYVVAVAGGIKPGEVGRLVSAGASIVIIGGGIVRHPDPHGAASEALRQLDASGATC
jgi:3-hexulose-6-phosphate synthase